MKRSLALGLALAILLVGATLPRRSDGQDVPTASAPPTSRLSPSTGIIQRYADALAALARPENVVFEYTVEQSGPQNLDQTHRVYRSGLRERDETLSADGIALKIPAVRIVPNSAYKYDVLALAPKPAEYIFVYGGARIVAGRAAYAFHTNPALAGPFAVNDVLIDAHRFLPLAIAFTSVGSGIKGKGRIAFVPVSRYWVAREVTVSAKRGTKEVRERIVWSKYRFPEALPASTFSAPHPVATASP